MCDWISFHLRPERDQEVSFYEKFRELHDEVEAWVTANKTKSVKLAKLTNVRDSGAQTWEQLGDRLTFAVICVKFRSRRDATLFKLFFADHLVSFARPKQYPAGYDPVLISLVRRAMPSVIAKDIIGVSPMTGPVAGIFSLRARYMKTLTKRAAKHRAQRLAKKKAVREQLAEIATKKKASVMQQLLENTLKELRGQ